LFFLLTYLLTISSCLQNNSRHYLTRFYSNLEVTDYWPAIICCHAGVMVRSSWPIFHLQWSIKEQSISLKDGL